MKGFPVKLYVISFVPADPPDTDVSVFTYDLLKLNIHLFFKKIKTVTQ